MDVCVPVVQIVVKIMNIKTKYKNFVFTPVKSEVLDYKY